MKKFDYILQFPFKKHILKMIIYLKESCSYYFSKKKCDDDAKKNYTDINLVDLSTDMECFYYVIIKGQFII